MLLKFHLTAACIFCMMMAKKSVPEQRNAGALKKIPTFRLASIIIDSASSIIPFSMAGNLIVVKGQADTTEGNFILDTGAPGLVLNLTYFRDYPQTLITDGDHTGITGASPNIIKTSVKTFVLGALNYYNTEADLTNLGNIENTRGIKILGLLGFDLFKNSEMIIDYDNSLIYLHRVARKEASTYQNEMLNDTSAYVTVPIDITDNRVTVSAQMPGKKLKFVIDCAAESNMLDSRLPGKVFRNVTVTRRVLLDGIGNKKIEASYGEASNIKMQNLNINGLPVLITNLENTCFSEGGCVDGVLGFDFLSRHKTGFNFVKHKMYIWK